MTKCKDCKNLFFMMLKMGREARLKCLINPNAFEDLRVGNWDGHYPDVSYCTHYQSKNDGKVDNE